MTQKIMMVVEQPRPVVMQTTEFVRGGGSSDYDALINKPAINGVTLEGDKTTAELGLPTKTSDLENDSGFITSVPVTSVNGQTGAVVLTASDVGAGTYSKPSGGIPKTDLASAVQTSLGKADAAYQKPSGGIPASDLAAGVIPTVPNKTSDLTNDSGFVNAAGAAAAAPIQSVNGKTGAVVLNAADVGAGTYSKPAGGIPATDLAAGVIPDLSGYATEQWVTNQGYLTQHQSLADYQPKSITDTGGYYTTDTVDGALQEIGAELAGINTLIGSGVIT